MNTSRLIILGVAAVAAAGAGYIAKNIATKPPAEIVAAAPVVPSIPLTDVLVLTDDVPAGQQLDTQMRWQSWPQAAVTDGFILRDQEADAMELLKGSVTRLTMYKGEPVRRSKLIGHGQSFMSAILPSGKRAVATQISADTSAGGFILPNDFVDVIMTRRGENGSSQGFVTETILKNIRVLAIDQMIQENEEGKRVKVGETATLELTPQQSEIITVAQQMADRLTLALRSITDTQEPPADDADYLVSGNGRRGTVRLIRSGEVTEVGARK